MNFSSHIFSSATEQENLLFTHLYSAVPKMKSSKKYLKCRLHHQGDLCWARMGERWTQHQSSKGTMARKATPKQRSPRPTLELQCKRRRLSQPWASRGIVRNPQDTSPLLLQAVDQHKQEPQAKHFGHEALFGSQFKPEPRIQICSRYGAVKQHNSPPPLPLHLAIPIILRGTHVPAGSFGPHPIS